jgi:flagellar hook-length control protein FliK
MQVTALPTAASIRSPVDLTNSAQARLAVATLLLPALCDLTKPGPQVQQLRQELQQADDKKRASEPKYPPAAAGFLPAGPTAAAVQAERRMKPGSLAARQDQMQRAAAQTDARRQTFQRDLAAASARERTPSAAPPAAPASRDSAAAGPPTAPRGATTTLPRASEQLETSGNSPASAQTTPAKSGSEVRPTSPSPQVSTRPSAAFSVTVARNPGAGATPAAAAAQKLAAQATAPVAQPFRASSAGSVWPTSGNGPAIRPGASAVAQRAAGTASSTRSRDINLEQILRLVRSQISRQRASAILRLDPPELGRIRLHLDLRQDTLSLRVQTQTELAYRLLSEQAELLRQGLAASGITLTKLEISPPAAADPADASGLPAQNPDGQSGSRPSADANAERSSLEGTDAPDADPAPPAVRLETEPAAESLVNLWA